MAIRSFSGNAKATTLSGDISAAATSINVVDGSGYPDGSVGPFVITIDTGLASEEKVLVATRTGNTLTVDTGGRGWDGTTAYDHENAASVQHTFSAVDAREANEHVNATTAAHPATAISYAGSTDLVATNVEAALDELDAEKISTTAANAAYEAKVSRTGATTGQVPKLQADGTLAFADDAAGISPTIVDAKGDLIAGSAADAVARLAAGADGQVLTADAAAALGVKWSPPAAGPVLASATPAVETFSTTSTTPVPLGVSWRSGLFKVPASGAITVTLRAGASADNSAAKLIWSVRTLGGAQLLPEAYEITGTTGFLGAPTAQQQTRGFRVTGLAAGTEIELEWMQEVIGAYTVTTFSQEGQAAQMEVRGA